MNLIILAAGQGTRLRPLTDNQPKCLVKYNEKPIIDYILDSKYIDFFNNIIIVDGYKADVLKSSLKNRDILFCSNPRYFETNMLHSLFCANKYFDEDIVISYSDIIYDESVMKSIFESKYEAGVVIDKKWKELWLTRMEDPLNDAETLKIKDNKIIEIGLKPKSYKEIEGQYIGLIKFSKNKLKAINKFKNKLIEKKIETHQSLERMHLTAFLQLMINNDFDIHPIYINGGWIEIDSVDDINNYNKKGISFDKS